MQSLMKTDFVTESYEEKLLCNRLEQMQESKEIKVFIKNIEEIVNKDIKIFSYRIKNSKSAIRTYRLTNYKSINQMHDLLGFLFVVEDEKHIKKLVKKLKKKINNNNLEVFNLLKEKPTNNIEYSVNENVVNNKYSELVFNSFNDLLEMPNNLKVLLPPFSYNLLCRKNFKDLEFSVPIEIRIQTKEDFITTESYYYIVHKNDTIPIEIKILLISICFRVLRRITDISFLSDNKEKELKRKEIEQVLNNNRKFIEDNKELINMIFSENNKLSNCWKNKQPIYEFKRYS